MKFQIQEMTIQQYDEVIELWKASEGVGLGDADSRENILSFLKLNPGLCFVARKGDKIIGAVLCGTDGRRGYLHHLAVDNSHRFKGVGKGLVERCMEALQCMGIGKCHIHVFEKNKEAISFWKKAGWVQRVDLIVMSDTLKNSSSS